MKTALLEIETHTTDWQKIDYRPFTEGVVRRGFDGDIFDIESGFIRMGARLYEPKTGRFTSVDPLFEAFKRWSPYAYSYNSPLTFRDPTGLAPEKEKYKDEILTLMFLSTTVELHGMWDGVAGEQAVGVGSKTRIPFLTGTAQYRIPDILTSTTLGEVKNARHLCLTRQLTDFHIYSQKYSLDFILYTRPTTTFSGPLQNLINNGSITIKYIPFK